MNEKEMSLEKEGRKGILLTKLSQVVECNSAHKIRLRDGGPSCDYSNLANSFRTKGITRAERKGN